MRLDVRRELADDRIELGHEHEALAARLDAAWDAHIGRREEGDAFCLRHRQEGSGREVEVAARYRRDLIDARELAERGDGLIGLGLVVLDGKRDHAAIHAATCIDLLYRQLHGVTRRLAVTCGYPSKREDCAETYWVIS